MINNCTAKAILPNYIESKTTHFSRICIVSTGILESTTGDLNLFHKLKERDTLHLQLSVGFIYSRILNEEDMDSWYTIQFFI